MFVMGEPENLEKNPRSTAENQLINFVLFLIIIIWMANVTTSCETSWSGTYISTSCIAIDTV